MTSTQATSAADSCFTPPEGFVLTHVLVAADQDRSRELRRFLIRLHMKFAKIAALSSGSVCGSLAERYASRTIQVADGQIASGVDAGAQR